VLLLLCPGIIKFRTWYHDCAGGDIPWPTAATIASGSNAQQQQQQQRVSLGPAKSREVVMDRLNQHTLQCKACSAALKWVQRLQVGVECRGDGELERRWGLVVCVVVSGLRCVDGGG